MAASISRWRRLTLIFVIFSSPLAAIISGSPLSDPSAIGRSRDHGNLSPSPLASFIMSKLGNSTKFGGKMTTREIFEEARLSGLLSPSTVQDLAHPEDGGSSAQGSENGNDGHGEHIVSCYETHSGHLSCGPVVMQAYGYRTIIRLKGLHTYSVEIKKVVNGELVAGQTTVNTYDYKSPFALFPVIIFTSNIDGTVACTSPEVIVLGILAGEFGFIAFFVYYYIDQEIGFGGNAYFQPPSDNANVLCLVFAYCFCPESIANICPVD